MDELVAAGLDQGVTESMQVAGPFPANPVRITRDHGLNMLIFSALEGRLGPFACSQLREYRVVGDFGRVTATITDAYLQSLLGVQCAQLAYAALSVYQSLFEESEWEECAPLVADVRDLMRLTSIIPADELEGFSSDEIKFGKSLLVAVSSLSFTRTTQGGDLWKVGQIFTIADECGKALTLDDIHSASPMVTIVPGRGYWELLQESHAFLPACLLSCDPISDLYAYRVGVYLSSYAGTRLDETVTFGTIADRADLEALEPDETRRMHRLHGTLDKLAQDGVIHGQIGFDGKITAIIEPREAKTRNPLAAWRAQAVRLKPAVATGDVNAR